MVYMSDAALFLYVLTGAPAGLIISLNVVVIINLELIGKNDMTVL